MSLGDTYLTQKGYEKLKQELEYMITVRRREISEALSHARSQGDISENAEYDAAKDAQALNEKRIAELEEKLTRTRIIDYENIPDDQALIGATVLLKDCDTQEEVSYTLVSELEADYAEGKISVTSPIGEGILGHKENETVEIKVPAGTLKYKILKITR
jgi:transcription elongation factor GreA